MRPIHSKIAQLTRSEREADKAWDEVRIDCSPCSGLNAAQVHKLQTEFGIQQKKHEQEMSKMKQLNAQLVEDKRNMAGKISELTKELHLERNTSAAERLKVRRRA